jgi:hypothetical protein
MRQADGKTGVSIPEHEGGYYQFELGNLTTERKGGRLRDHQTVHQTCHCHCLEYCENHTCAHI